MLFLIIPDLLYFIDHQNYQFKKGDFFKGFERNENNRNNIRSRF